MFSNPEACEQILGQCVTGWVHVNYHYYHIRSGITLKYPHLYRYLTASDMMCLLFQVQVMNNKLWSTWFVSQLILKSCL